MALPYGLVAICVSMLLDCICFTSCALAPCAFVHEDDAKQSKRVRFFWLRLLEATALARLFVVSIISVPSVGARCCAKRSLLVGWIWANTGAACACAVATAWRVAVAAATDARAVAFFLLCLSSLLSCRLLAGVVDYIRADVSPELDVYLYLVGLWKQPAAAAAHQDDESLLHSSSAALSRFAKRSSSIRAFWRDRLTLVRRLARDLVVVREKGSVGLLLEEEERQRREDFFGLLLRLFAHEGDVLEPITQAFERDPTIVAGRALQLTGFALFGAYPDGPKLRNWLLELCRDEKFAHRVQWYLDAFVAAGIRLTAEATLAVGALSADVRRVASVGTFEETPRLVDALTEISRDLKSVDRESRNDALRERLRDLNAAMLPSGYVPLLLRSPRVRGRILRIHEAESKVFSTKDRCPYLVCLEVETDVKKQTCEDEDDDDDDDDVEQQKRIDSSGAIFRSRRSRRRCEEDELAEKGSEVAITGQCVVDDDEPLGQWRSESLSPHRRERSYGSLLARAENESDEECRGSGLAVICDGCEDEQEPAPTVVFREGWKEKQDRILGGRGGGVVLVPVIVKARDDLRQEQFASQLIFEAASILESAKLPVWMRPYEVLATGPDSGLIEAIPDTVSLDALRRNDSSYVNLLDFFRHFFVDDVSSARESFVASLAPACIVSYLLQLKDRHNGNILLDRHGHLIHIDFGYMLSSSPGGNMGFEAAPFKLTAEFLDVIGRDARSLRKFRDLCYRTFLALRRQSHRLVLLAEMTVIGCEHLPCFDGRPRETIDALKARFKPSLTSRQLRTFVDGLIDKSINNWRTSLYDQYQRRCVGIF